MHPPSTTKVVPVTYVESGPQKKATAPEISSEFPTRCSGNMRLRASCGNSLTNGSLNGVRTHPGATAFTRMPCGPSSTAIVFVNVMIAAFEEL